jgi:methionine-rich copper-binding protein CopC
MTSAAKPERWGTRAGLRATVVAAACLMGLAATHAPSGEALRHFALSRSAPAADATVPSPTEVRLWFSQVAQPGSVAIRLIDARGAALDTGEPTRDAEDGRVYAIAVGRTLGAGPYTVSWRGIGDDGHTVRGEFRFTVSAQ